MRDRPITIIDYESYSEANLKAVGGWEYSVHPTTDILCVAWRTGTRETLRAAPIKTWSPLKPNNNIQLLLSAFENPNMRLVAHNAYFEQVITKNVLARKLHTQAHYLAHLPPERWACTAAMAAALALPRNLENAALALRLPVEKDMAGRRLMLKWSKPRKPTKHNPKTRHDDPEELDRIIQYCATDIEVETELYLKCPPLTKAERQVWLMDQRINLRGFGVDREMVQRVLSLLPLAKEHALARVRVLSDGALKSTAQHTGLLKWLEEQGCFLPDLKAKTVADAITEGLATGAALEMLQHRQSLSKTSTAKYSAFEMRSRHDGRIRDSLIYHGASPGRWSGAGIQPQNLPRPTLKQQAVELALEILGELEK